MVNKRLGFTLIELLITISIISVLAVIGLIAYGTFLKSARDARRESDLKFIQSALEQYHGDQKYYPASLTYGQPLVFGTKIYINAVPADPTANPQYLYQATGTNCAAATPQNCSSYCLFAKLESKNPNKTEGNCTLTSTYNLGVTRP